MRSALLGFALQGAALACLATIPLLMIPALPARQEQLTVVTLPPPPPVRLPRRLPLPPPLPYEVAKVEPATTGLMKIEVFREPIRIPTRTVTSNDEFVNYGERAEAPSMSGVLGGVSGGVAGGALTGAMGGVLPRPKPPALAKPEEPRRPVRISQGVSSGMLLQRVIPEYPSFARRARIQGTVEIQAIISKQGTVDQLEVLRGSSMLRDSAIKAVSQWRYRPYFLNGEPIEVETIISVHFTLNGD